MGTSMLGFIVWISLLMASNHGSVLARLVNTTLHSTHPQVAYAPESCCVKNIFGGCKMRYDPFTMSTYVDLKSMKRTFFQTSSWGNEPQGSNMNRRVEISFYGRAVYVYGAPQVQLDNLPGHIQLSLDGEPLETINLEAKYRELDWDPWARQPLYHWESRKGDALHVLQISLLDDTIGDWKWHQIRGFGFDSVDYTSEQRLPPKYKLKDFEKLENITIHDTNFVTSFAPSFAWEKNITDATAGLGAQTFHATSNELAHNSQRGLAPVAEFSAQCTALAIYGASPAQLEAMFAKGFRHGHIQLCLGLSCEYIDLHHAYLNVPSKSWNAPVLLYSNDRMWPGVVKPVTLRFLDPPSPVGHQWIMSFSHAVCSQVAPKWVSTHPMPGGEYSSHVVQYHKLNYEPTFYDGLITPWVWMDTYSFADVKPYWFFGTFGDMPSWSTIIQGHDIKIFIPLPALFPVSRYSNVRCCIHGNCHYPDIEQWFLSANGTTSDVPLVHYKDLNPFMAHQISMTAVRRADERGDKITAVSRIEFQRVEFHKQPPVPPSPPSEPGMPIPYPPPPLPIPYPPPPVPIPYPPPPVPVGGPKSNILALAVEVLLFAIILGRVSLLLLPTAKWLFRILLPTVKWLFLWVGPNPHAPLLHNHHCAPPSYVSYGTMDTTPNLPPRPHDPITEPATVPQRYRE